MTCKNCGCIRGEYGGWWKHPNGLCERFGGCSHRCDHKCRHPVSEETP